jgi:hypothetical protein
VTQSGPVMQRDHGRSSIGTDVGVDTATAIPTSLAATDASSADVRRVEAAERDVRETLRGQIARLERESSAIVAETFPHISPVDQPDLREHPRNEAIAGPRLLTLAELERVRDRVAGHTQDLRRLAAARVEHERRAREQLEAMQLEPGRHKLVRLPVRDLGEGGCGVWEVRPRLGLIGMLAGWWQVKLSSGCPLPRGRACARPLLSISC